MSTNNSVPIKKDFSTQRPDEKVILILRKHWFILAWPFFKGALFITIAALLPTIGKMGFYIFNSVYVSVIYFIWIIFWANYLVYEYLNWYRDQYIITDKRVINVDQRSLFKRRVSEVELDKIQDIIHEINGVNATTFNFGDVIIASAGSDKIELHDIPQPASIQSLLFKLVKEATKNPPVSVDELVDFIKKQRI